MTDVSKVYRLGQVGTGTLAHDLNRWWATLRGKEDPTSGLAVSNDQTKGQGEFVWALRNLDFEVSKGQIVGIIGKNGAGKSTLLKLLSRVTAPSRGRICVSGRMASLLEVGTGFHPELTGRENIFLNGAMLGMARRETQAKFDEIVEFSGCRKYIDTPIKRYSSGMYVRLAFAVAAHLEPDILIVDEVLAVGDVDFQRRAIGRIREVCGDEGRTVLIVSHNMTTIRSLCSRALLLDKGRVSFDGVATDAVSSYLSSVRELARSELKMRSDRYGDGALRFSEAWVESESGVRGEVSSGDEVHLIATFSITAPLTNLYFAFALYDEEGNQLADLYSQCVAEAWNVDGNEGRVVCTLERLPLNQGTYYFNVYAKSNNVVNDAVEAACFFRVSQGDFFETGVMPSASQGKILFSQSWKLEVTP